ncbi:MAG TPA: cation-translocating P-type ATPase [Chitinophagaceae bacterium]
MEKVLWKVDGMTCANCALTIHKYLEKEGMKDVKVNAIGGDVSFESTSEDKRAEIRKGINSLGYRVAGDVEAKNVRTPRFNTSFARFLLCLPFTILLMLHMVVHVEWLMDRWIQLLLSAPVYVIGMTFFGKSAVNSLKNGLPNMNVLVTLGATAAFGYSLYGSFTANPSDYLFYETAAAIITLVFFGNYLEDASLRSTQKALNALVRSQKVMANMIAYDNDHNEHIFPVENTQLKVGDLVLIKAGEQVPVDCKVLSGNAEVSEAIITGESLPVSRGPRDRLIGGSLLQEGTVKAQVTAAGPDTVLSGIIDLVKRAQGDKPPVQQLADRISAIFVPVVIGIAVVTIAINWIYLGSFTPSLMRGIAVLVIACPCAMGLATPAAIAVGLGRAARSGVLFRNSGSLEVFKNIRQVVFDKTGTLTTGNFSIASYRVLTPVDAPAASAQQTAEDPETSFRTLVYSIEKYSNHPIAASVAAAWKTRSERRWTNVEERKGVGVFVKDQWGIEYAVGSDKILDTAPDEMHSVYVTRDGKLVGWLDLADEARPEAAAVVGYLRQKNIRTVLLSGDRYAKCLELGEKLGIDEVIAGQSPEQKLQVIERLAATVPTAMIGDGINDAPALAKATVGISLSEASQIAMQSAQVVLMGNGLNNLPVALGLGRHTYATIRQNLFWAFFYNVIAIPVAAFGFLTPTVGALVMGLSDVVLGINSARLFVKKVV